MMQDPEARLGDAGLVFAARNNHTAHCGQPPRIRNSDNPRLYHGYFENRYGEQFVFTYDALAKTGMVCGAILTGAIPSRSASHSSKRPTTRCAGSPQ